MSLSRVLIENEVLAFDPAQFAEAIPQRGEHPSVGRRVWHHKGDACDFSSCIGRSRLNIAAAHPCQRGGVERDPAQPSHH